MGIKIGKYRLVDIMNPIKWYRAIRWKLYGDSVGIKKGDLTDISEMMVYRGMKCPECRNAGMCIYCGCDWEAKASLYEEKCVKGNWDSTSKEKWKEFTKNWKFKKG